MALVLKEGTKVNGLKPEIIIALIVAESVYEENGFQCVVTAGTNGIHSEHSLHYKGLAVDLRTRDMGKGTQSNVVETIQLRLGSDYDVILENDHIHVEYDPKQ